jgi:hypothetical protein
MGPRWCFRLIRRNHERDAVIITDPVGLRMLGGALDEP